MKTYEQFFEEEIRLLPTMNNFWELSATIQHFTRRNAAIRLEFQEMLRELQLEMQEKDKK